MTFTEEFHQLPPDDRCKHEESLAVCGLAVSDVENLLRYRIALKGKKLRGNDPRRLRPGALGVAGGLLPDGGEDPSRFFRCRAQR